MKFLKEKYSLGKEDIHKSLQMITDALLLKKCTLDELAEAYSEGTDQFISYVESDEKLTFVAGKFFLKCVSKSAYEALADLYFKDSNDGWVKKELKSVVNPQSVTVEALQTLNEIKIAEYPISAPAR